MLVYTASPKCYCNICHRVEAFGTDQDSPSWWVLSKTSPAFHLLSFSPPEVGLFGADVGTDLVNGHNLIKTGDPIWGTLMISLPFLPALILGILLVLMAIGQKNWCTLCLVLLFFVPLVALATPLYILLVLIIGLSRVVSPDFSWTFFGFDLTTSLNSMLRMLEVTGESYPQLVLGEKNTRIGSHTTHLELYRLPQESISSWRLVPQKIRLPEAFSSSASLPVCSLSPKAWLNGGSRAGKKVWSKMHHWQQSSLCPCSSFPMSYFERLPSLSPLPFLATMRLPPSSLLWLSSWHCPSPPTTPREEGTKGTRVCSTEHLERQSSHQWPTTLGQTWNLSKNLQDRIFGWKNFTHWKRVNRDYFRQH